MDVGVVGIVDIDSVGFNAEKLEAQRGVEADGGEVRGCNGEVYLLERCCVSVVECKAKKGACDSLVLKGGEDIYA